MRCQRSCSFLFCHSLLHGCRRCCRNMAIHYFQGSVRMVTVRDMVVLLCVVPLVIPAWWIRYFGCKKEFPLGYQQRRPKVTHIVVHSAQCRYPFVENFPYPAGWRGVPCIHRKVLFLLAGPPGLRQLLSRQWNKAGMIIHRSCVSAFVFVLLLCFPRSWVYTSTASTAAGHPAYISREFMRLIEPSSLISSLTFPECFDVVQIPSPPSRLPLLHWKQDRRFIC